MIWCWETAYAQDPSLYVFLQLLPGCRNLWKNLCTAEGNGLQHQNKTTGDEGECYLNLLFPVSRRSMFFFGYLPQINMWRRETWKEWPRSRKTLIWKEFEKTEIFLLRIFIQRATMNAYQIMNGLQKTNVCSSGLIPQLERQHNDNKRIEDFKKQ